MKKNLAYTAFVALILLLCLIPSAGMLFNGRAETGGNEILAVMPSLRGPDGALNTDYLSDLTAYAGDNYFLRQRLVTAWSALNQKLLHTSITDSVLLGRDGWLYFAETLGGYTGAETLSSREISSAAHNLALMAEYAQGRGARFLFTVAPNKNTVYPEHMPDLPVFSPERSAGALAAALAEEGVPYLDLISVFASQDETLYFTQDSHWNSKGAALVAESINAALDREGTRYFHDGSFSPEDDHLSDLYAMLYPTSTWRETDMKYDGELVFDYDVPIRDANSITIMTTGQGEGSLLMFRDSFGNLLYPYMADGFEHALFSRGADYRLDLIAEREADCVVIELVERNLDYLLRYVPVMPAPVREAPETERELDGHFSLEVEPSRDMEGYVLLKGALPESLPAYSSVLLCTGRDCYEAFQLKDGHFALYVPEDTLTGDQFTVLLAGEDGGMFSIPALL